MSRKLLLAVLLTGLWATLHSLQQPWWYTLELGKQHFKNGSYGDALIILEDARRERIAHFTRLETELITFLSRPEIRQFEDSLAFTEKYIAEQGLTEIAAILEEVYHYYPQSSFDGSARRVLQALGRLKSYPDAEYWLGEIFRIEGEFVLAQRQYEAVLRDKALLQTPDFDLEVLYRITDVHRVRSEYADMERRFKEIIEGVNFSGTPRDVLWVPGDGSLLIRAAMSRVLENDGIDRFFTLYRHNNMATERAHRLLGFHYYSRGRYAVAAEHIMFAFLIQNTVLIDELVRRNFDFSYTSLDNLATSAAMNRQLLGFIEETEYYRTVYYLSSALYANGRIRPALELWNFLAGSDRSGEWGARARRTAAPVVEGPANFPN